MASNSMAISTEELRAVLESLKQQRETISETYNSMIKKVLESSSYCFSVSGLDYSSIISAFDNTFRIIDARFESLINVLENNVIKNYSELTIAIRKMFDSEFASKISELLNFKN